MNRLVVVALLIGAPLLAQDSTAGRGGRGRRGGGRPVVVTDTARGRSLFGSKDPKELPGCEPTCHAQIRSRIAAESTYEARSKGVMEFRRVSYKSRVDGLEIPAYLFAPLTKNPNKHAALVWVHGGVHGNWGM